MFLFRIINGSEIEEPFDIPAFHFSGSGDFSGTRFKKNVNFDSAKCSYDLRLNRTEFGGEATFRSLEMSGRLFGRDVQFRHGVVFTGAAFRKSVLFLSENLRTVFGGEARFNDTHFESTAEFDGVYFEGQADFTRVNIEKSCMFRALRAKNRLHPLPMRFGSSVTFRDATIGGATDFSGAQFDGQSTSNA
jgi:uncharacterized protein YjbI with pentapeptide repeats